MQKEWYLGELEQGAVKKEVVAKTFKPAELDFARSGKMKKKEGWPKVESWGTWH